MSNSLLVKILIAMIGLLLATCVLVAGVVLYFEVIKPQNATGTGTETASPQTEIGGDETFVTLADQKFGYSIQHPEGWTANQYEPGEMRYGSGPADETGQVMAMFCDSQNDVAELSYQVPPDDATIFTTVYRYPKEEFETIVEWWGDEFLAYSTLEEISVSGLSGYRWWLTPEECDSVWGEAVTVIDHGDHILVVDTAILEGETFSANRELAYQIHNTLALTK